MTGAASDALSHMLGPATGNCGNDDVGGCGKCLLVQNPSARNSDWTAIVMKKNRCPPWSNGCDVAHFDLAVPGYDNLQYSTANCCGSGSKENTHLTKSQSSVCGDWYRHGSSTIEGCNCSSLPKGTYRDGCDLFSSWGWTSGDPVLNYRVVDCPSEYEKIVSSAFDANGPTKNFADWNEYFLA